MESFFRYISYIDYYEEGKKEQTSGYMVWRHHNACHHLEIHLKDSDLDPGTLDLIEENSGLRLGEITVEYGRGEFVADYSSYGDNKDYLVIDGKQLYLSEIKGIQISLGRNRMLYGKLILPVEKAEKKEKTEETVFSKREEINEKAILDESKEVNGKVIWDEKREIKEEENEKRIVKEYEEEIQEEEAGKKEIKKDEIKKTKQHVDSNMVPKVMEETKRDMGEEIEVQILKPMEEQKWKQLCHTYPVVYPFPSHQVFISIHPKDFIILQEGYQRLVHNSFLLHGYYNYDHLILGKLDDNMESPYYIGVPGVYYEREKRAARMFGFVGFECADQVIENGSFGYYMIEVKI